MNSFTWSPDSANLFFTADDRGRQDIQIIPVNGGAARMVASGDAELDDMQFTRDGKTMVYTQQSRHRRRPRSIASSSTGGAPAADDAPQRRGAQRRQITPLEEFCVDSPTARACIASS